VEPSHHFRGPSADLDEMLGNLLDNACKWARGRVKLSSGMVAETLLITIDDDGPGIDAALREIVLQRGVRLDETPQGSGLGLAIVRELAETYGGSITLGKSPRNGLRGSLSLPGCLRPLSSESQPGFTPS
jgi:signal transduction histidine kinase